MSATFWNMRRRAATQRKKEEAQPVKTEAKVIPAVESVKVGKGKKAKAGGDKD